MGGNKPFAPFGGGTLIGATLDRLRPQADEIIINAGLPGTNIAKALAGLGVPLVFDELLPGLGPLSGVVTAVNWAFNRGFTKVITAPCDMPYLPEDMVAQLQAAPDDADVVHFSGARDYPLCASWQVSILPELLAALNSASAKGGLAVMRFLALRRVHRIPVTDDAAFANINTVLGD